MNEIYKMEEWRRELCKSILTPIPTEIMPNDTKITLLLVWCHMHQKFFTLSSLDVKD